jgi:hypothetical protein
VGHNFEHVIVQHLQATYGTIMSDKVLLYSLLAMGTARQARFPGSRDTHNRVILHCCYTARFKEIFARARQLDQVKEEHFFAFALAAFTCAASRPGNRLLPDYHAALLDVLDHLSSKVGHVWRLSPLIGYVLFLLRRFDLQNSTTGQFQCGMNCSYRLYNAGRMFVIPLDVGDKRVLWGSVAWLQSVQEVGRAECEGLFIRCKDDIHALWVAFNTWMSGENTLSQVGEILYSVGMSISAIEDNPAMITWFQEVPSLSSHLTQIDSPFVEVKRSYDYQRRFLKQYFHLRALFGVMQYIHHKGKIASSQYIHILRQIELAESHYALRYKHWWFIYLDSLYSVLGLLIHCLLSSQARNPSPQFRSAMFFVKDCLSFSPQEHPTMSCCPQCHHLNSEHLKSLWNLDAYTEMLEYLSSNLWIWGDNGFNFDVKANLEGGIPRTPVALCAGCCERYETSETSRTSVNEVRQVWGI